MKKIHAAGIAFLVFVILISACGKKIDEDSYAQVVALFSDPPASYRSAPLWVWNSRVTEEQIESQLADFKARGIGGVFIHPRPGLITPYLSEEWLALCRHAVEMGKKLGLSVWLYDENSYPSGFAGGHVPAEMPEAIGLGLRMAKATEIPFSFVTTPYIVLRSTEVGFLDITEQALNPDVAKKLGQGDYYLFYIEKASPSPWFGGFAYVDLMRREVTEKFLQITLDVYKEVIGSEFGQTVPGVFQDEAQISPVGGKDVINFTPGLFDAFRKKWGYDLRFHLPSFFEERGDWKRVRHNNYALLLELFIEGWAKPYYDYCERNRLIFTGHYWEHEWPIPRLSPDNMALAAYAHMPGIDCLMNEWQMGPHAQFGNARAVKEIRSVANQLGKRRTLSETYGAGGWDMTLADQKRIADWEFSLGVNFINQHLSYMTIMGARKRDHPLSFSDHEPWWHAYGVLADYLGRLTVAMSSGEQVNRILVLEPTTTGWMYYSPAGKSNSLERVGTSFQDFVNRLEAEQIEYDLGSEDILKNHARVERGKLIVGQRNYKLVVIPPGLENLNGPTAELLEQYLRRGGRVLSVAGTPGFIDGRSSERFSKLALRYPARWRNVEWPGLDDIEKMSPQDLCFSGIEGPKEFFFHHRRELKDAQLVFLANVSPEKPVSGKLLLCGGAVEKWDPWTGKTSPYPFLLRKGRVEVDFEIPAGGSLLLCFKKAKAQPFITSERERLELPVHSELEIRREKPNILTLDYCDLKLDGKVERDLYFYDAQKRTFERHGLERNPWDSAVQFKTNILDLDKFPPTSGFEATYWFEIGAGVRLETLELVIERPELYQVFANGQKIAPVPERWWLDRAFGVFAIGELARSGKNWITLRAQPFTIHTELEPIYLRGDFRLESQSKGFKLVPAGELKLGPWSAQGLPFYADGVSYTRKCEVSPFSPGKDRYFVKLGDWLGAVAEIRVNNKVAGFVIGRPFEVDITERLVNGENWVSIIVYGTLKNTLGPHHNNPPLGRAWPGSFQRGADGGFPPGSAYHVVGYGLFEDFKVIVEARTP
ncbi:MAG: glycosyl hydrolase [Clostridiales bacterium]|nr:glycosyl hydrolase [Clostridiales bacterium]